jgi:hypothetical protein
VQNSRKAEGSKPTFEVVASAKHESDGARGVVLRWLGDSQKGSLMIGDCSTVRRGQVKSTRMQENITKLHAESVQNHRGLRSMRENMIREC